LHEAAMAGHRDVVELLLANKAEVNTKNGNGMTPLDYAETRGRKDVLELLAAHHGSHE
jgi:ankyrin repeat protein